MVRTAAALEATIRLPLPVDLRLTLGPLGLGASSTLTRHGDGSWWRGSRTPDGPATASFVPCRTDPRRVEARAWGPGAEWALRHAPELLGSRDSLDGFDPPPGLMKQLHRRMPGLRITRSRAVFEALLRTVPAQKVTGVEAGRAYTALVRRFGEPAPFAEGAPAGLFVPPSPERLAELPYFAWHRLGIEMRRANVLRHAAARAAKLEEAVGMPPQDARRRLMAFIGVGAWTAAEVAIVALGDADAVSVGDYHLPNTVSWALAGESRGTDERMLELLAPFAGHRGRVIRLIEAAGIAAPRFGPKMPVRSFRAL
jgi:3-methyladenine DNA glycosylase/8-oxoguanine DNA glycosylase